MFKNIGDFHEKMMRKHVKKLKRIRSDLAEKDEKYAHLLVGDNTNMTKYSEDRALDTVRRGIARDKVALAASMSIIPKCKNMAKLKHVKWPELSSLTTGRPCQRGVSLSAEFTFMDTNKGVENQLTINIPGGHYGWDELKKVAEHKHIVFDMGQHRWVTQTTRSLTIIPELKVALAKQIDWRKAFRKFTAKELYNELLPGVGHYMTIQGGHNVLAGAGLKGSCVGLVVSTSNPKFAYEFKVYEPFYLHNLDVLDSHRGQSRVNILFGMCFGRGSGTFDRSPRRFHRAARDRLTGFPVNTWEGKV